MAEILDFVNQVPEFVPLEDIAADTAIDDSNLESILNEQPLLYALPKDVDPTKFSLAYGRRGIPLLISELSDTRLLIRQRSLVHLSLLLKNPENVTQALDQNIVRILSSILSEVDLATKQKASECLLTICGQAIGRKVIITLACIPNIAKLFDDSDPLVRKNCHQIFSRVSGFLEGVQNIHYYSVLPELVKKLPNEKYDIQVYILETLYNCIRLGKEPSNPHDAIKSHALDEFTNLVSNSFVTEIKIMAAKCIMALSFFTEAKKLATEGQTIKALLNLLRDSKSPVRAAAAGALMSITVYVDAKKLLVKENGLTQLMALLYDRNPEVVLNVIKTITNCSEDYRGRFQLHAALPKLEEIKAKSPNPQIETAATVAIKVITWRPVCNKPINSEYSECTDTEASCVCPNSIGENTVTPLQRAELTNVDEIQVEQNIPEVIENEEILSIQELRFFMNQLYKIFKPVGACIALSILWVKLTNNSQEYWSYGFSESSSPKTSVAGGGTVSGAFDSNGDTSSSGLSLSALIAIIIISQIVVATFLIMCLFRYRQFKILYGFIFLTVVVLLGYFGYALGSNLLFKFNVPFDYISFIFYIWNWTVVGVILIFYKGPMLLQQIYLVIMSSLMAYNFSSLPASVTWILLSLLAIWDLIAVLCPYGPLKLLIESSKSQNQEIPALLYTVAIWTMASIENSTIKKPPVNHTRHSIDSSNISHESDGRDTRALTTTHENAIPEEIEMVDISQPPPTQRTTETFSRSGLKLGLGDFVFYSVLVGRAALFDWVTTAACTIAVISGLTMTILLLAVYKKALPALPLSISFGILFYLVSAVVLVPFINSLTPLELKITVSDDNGLWVGKTGATTYFI